MTESELQKFDTIRSWLNGKKNYQQGIMLLKVYHPDQDKVRSLEKFQNEHMLNHLMRELYEELKEKKMKVESVEPQAASIQSHKKPDVTITVDAEPLVEHIKSVPGAVEKIATAKSSDLKKLAEIKKARTQLYKERAAFHKEMGDIAYLESGTLKPVLIKHEIERRHELAKSIIDHTTEIDKYWSVTDYYETHGTFPADFKKKVAKPAPMTNAEALRKLMNTRSTITKTAKKISDAKILLPTLTGKELEKSKTQLASWDAKLKILEAEKLELEKQVHEQKDN